MVSDEPDGRYDRETIGRWEGEPIGGADKRVVDLKRDLLVERFRREHDEARQQRDELLEAIETAIGMDQRFRLGPLKALYDTAKKIRERNDT